MKIKSYNICMFCTFQSHMKKHKMKYVGLTVRSYFTQCSMFETTDHSTHYERSLNRMKTMGTCQIAECLLGCFEEVSQMCSLGKHSLALKLPRTSHCCRIHKHFCRIPHCSSFHLPFNKIRNNLSNIIQWINKSKETSITINKIKI